MESNWKKRLIGFQRPQYSNTISNNDAVALEISNSARIAAMFSSWYSLLSFSSSPSFLIFCFFPPKRPHPRLSVSETAACVEEEEDEEEEEEEEEAFASARAFSSSSFCCNRRSSARAFSSSCRQQAWCSSWIRFYTRKVVRTMNKQTPIDFTCVWFLAQASHGCGTRYRE